VDTYERKVIVYNKYIAVQDLNPGDQLDLFRDKYANPHNVDNPYRWTFPEVEAVVPAEVESGDMWNDGELLDVWVYAQELPHDGRMFHRFPRRHEVKVVS